MNVLYNITPRAFIKFLEFLGIFRGGLFIKEVFIEKYPKKKGVYSRGRLKGLIIFFVCKFDPSKKSNAVKLKFLLKVPLINNFN